MATGAGSSTQASTLITSSQGDSSTQSLEGHGTNGDAGALSESPKQLPTASFEQRNEALAANRAPRPPSLYVPLDESKAESSTSAPSSKTSAYDDPNLAQGVSTPSSLSSWPFDHISQGNNSLGVHSPFVGPLSPSEIHPSYADSPSAPLLHASPPTPTDPPHNLYSAIPMSAVSDSDASFASSAARLDGRGSSSLYGSKKPYHIPHPVGMNGALSAEGDGSFLSRLARDFDSPKAWLVLYFMFNLGLTLFNKLVLQGFPFAWTLTAIQMLSGTIGTQIALHRGAFTQAHLTTKENGVMLMFSGLYTINIAVSNLSLGLVSVPVSGLPVSCPQSCCGADSCLPTRQVPPSRPRDDAPLYDHHLDHHVQ